MPGDNCAIPGCSASRATPGVALFGSQYAKKRWRVQSELEKKQLAWSLKYGWLMLVWRGNLKGNLYAFVKSIILRRNWYDVSIKLWPYYDCSKLFLQKTLVDLRKKNTEKYRVILHQQLSEHYYYTLMLIFRKFIDRSRTSDLFLFGVLKKSLSNTI